MYCKKCKFTSYDFSPTCPKCGSSWEDSKDKLNVNWISGPGYNWLGEENSTEESVFTGEDRAPSTGTDETFSFEATETSFDQGTTQSAGGGKQSAGMEELKFDEFEEVKLGEADTGMEADELEAEEVDLESEAAGSQSPEAQGIDQELGELEDLDLGMDEAESEPSSKKKTQTDDLSDISLDDLDLDLDE